MKWPRLTTVLAVLLVMIVMSAGFAGIQKTPFADDGLLSNLYRILGLFFVDGGWTLETGTSTPWELQVARFSAPAFSLLLILTIFIESFRRRLRMVLRKRRGVSIVFGLSDTGIIIAEALHQAEQPVTIVDIGSDAKNLETAHRLGIPVVLRDMLDARNPVHNDLRYARSLFFTSGSDTINFRAATMASEIAESHGNRECKINVEVRDLKLSVVLSQDPRFTNKYSHDFAYFDIDDLVAQELLKQFPPSRYADLLNLEQPHIAIIGWSQFAVRMLRQLALIGPYKPLTRFNVDLYVSPNVEKAVPEEFARLFNLKIIPTAEGTSPHFGSTEYSQYFMCDPATASLEGQAHAMRADLLQRGHFLGPIIYWVGKPDEPLFVNAVEALQHTSWPDGVFGISFSNHSFDILGLIDKNQQAIALQSFQAYSNFAKSRSPYTWHELSNEKRHSTLLQLQSWGTKLEAVGLSFANRASQPAPELSDADLELLEAMEHERWRAERVLSGWKYGPRRSDQAKIHPDLVEWADLSAEASQFNSEFLTNQWEIVKNNGISGSHKGVTRTCVIGITGHRWRTLNLESEKRLQEAIDSKLNEIERRWGDVNYIALSGGADGADRLVSHRAKKMLGAQIVVLMPMPYDFYRNEFLPDANNTIYESEREFLDLIAASTWHAELPLAQTNRAGGYVFADDKCKDRQYQLLGQYISSRSNEMIAVWDGLAARGPGGTADVVNAFEESPTKGSSYFPAPHSAVVEVVLPPATT